MRHLQCFQILYPKIHFFISFYLTPFLKLVWPSLQTNKYQLTPEEV